MWFFWFILTIVFFVLWRQGKSAVDQDPQTSDLYAQGYWDGYRAFAAKVRDVLSGPEISRDQLANLIREGDGSTLAEADSQQAGRIESSHQEASVVASVSMTDEQLSLQKQRTSISNLNTILYMASFLLVAAAAAFVAAAMSPAVRLAGLWAVVVLFYASGYILHKRVPRLRPAAAAFLGTGLAILPFAGIALTMLGGVSDSWAWLITSGVGLVAYAMAAVLLQSQFVSYLTMAFVLSLAGSFAGATQAAFVWYFIMLIGVSLVANLVSFLKPSWIPQLFQQPIESTGQLVTPLALMASIFLTDKMEIGSYEIVFGVATAHYLVVWLQQRTVLYETIIRVIGYSTLFIIAWDVANESYVVFGVWWLILAVLQIVYSLLRIDVRDAKNVTRESRWLAFMTAVLVVGMVYWQGQENAAALTLVSLITIGLSSLVSTLRLRNVNWAFVGLAASVTIPFVVARWLVQPVLSWETLAIVFVVLSSLVVGVYHYIHRYHSLATRIFFAVAYGAYGGAAILSALWSTDSGVMGWTFAVLAALTAVLSYISYAVTAEVIAGLLMFVAIAAWLVDTSIDKQWYVAALALVSAGVAYVATVVHQFTGEASRRNQMLILGQIYVGLLVFNGFGGNVEVIQASFIVLLAAALVSFGLRVASREKSVTVQSTFVLSYFTYLFLAWMLSFQLGAGWSVLVYTAGALLFWLGSYVELVPGLVIFGNLALTVAIATLWNWLAPGSEWQVFGVAWIVSAILYGIYWVCVYQGDTWRQWACLVSIWTLLGGAVLLQFETSTVQQIAAAATLIVTAGTLSIQGYLSKSKAMIESGIYVATFGMQRIVGITIPETTIAFYGHWWAIVIGLVAWWREEDMTKRLIVAMAFVTFSTGVIALSEGGGYQLLFLVEHLILLVVGALLSKSWAIWWGIAASALAVMYFLKNFLFLWLGFLGLLLIGIVVWRLVRMSTKSN
jgi:hypothetical protein